MTQPAIHIHVLPGGRIGLERAGAGGVAVIDPASSAFATTLRREDVDGIDSPEPDTYTQCHAVVGITHFGDGERYLLAATARQLICRIQEHDIWRITGGLVIPLFEARNLKPQSSSLRTEFLSFCTELLESGRLYYSETFDLTRSLQKQTTGQDKDTDADDFLFNSAARQVLVDNPALAPFALRFIAGFAGSFPLDIAGADGKTDRYNVFIIARNSRQRLGTRYTRRGLDAEGHAANFVEMEQLVWREEDPLKISSFVQIRGSVPTVWKQSLDLNWKPKMTIADQRRPEVRAATEKHFASLEKDYLAPDGVSGKIICVDLLNSSGFEKPLTDAYKEVVAVLGDPRIEYEAFWVNRYCKNFDYAPLNTLLERTHERLVANGIFVGVGKLSSGLEARRYEAGTVRTSCLDSLDRTNMVCTMIAKDVLIYQLAEVGANPGGASFNTLGSSTEWIRQAQELALFPMNNIYADAGDAISLIYSGTGHMKSDVVRTGRRQWIMGSWLDGRNSLSRYYLNNFRDGVKQDVFDLWNGIVSDRELTDEEERDQVIRAAEEPPSFAESDGVGVLRLPSITDIWQKARTYSDATGMSSVLALVLLFGKWISPRRVDSIIEFSVGLVVSAVFFFVVKVFGVDRRLVVSEPKIKRDDLTAIGSPNGTGDKKED